MQLAVETFKTVPPEDFFTSLPEVVKLSAFGASLGGITLLGIKLSFVCFFRGKKVVWLAVERKGGISNT